MRFPRNVEYGDITRGLPVPSDSCRALFCSHVLEHLALRDLTVALVESYRIIRKGGLFRLVVPDLELCILNYTRKSGADAAIEFMRDTLLGKETRKRTLNAFLREWLGNSSHLWMWDYKSMERELRNVGFVNIRRANYGDATDPAFRDVEEEERWQGCLGIECRK
jgi:predicted SAM-dependent methyltransferase